MSADAGKSNCRKFTPNIFNKSKCQTCFRDKSAHTAEALESSKAARKVSKCGYLFVAPDNLDIHNVLHRSRRWQRRWFVLYDDGELTFSVDEHPDTIPQGVIDMNKCTEVLRADGTTGHDFSILVTANGKHNYFKGTSKEEMNWWFDVLVMFPRSLKKPRSKRMTYPTSKVSLPSPEEIVKQQHELSLAVEKQKTTDEKRVRHPVLPESVKLHHTDLDMHNANKKSLSPLSESSDASRVSSLEEVPEEKLADEQKAAELNIRTDIDMPRMTPRMVKNRRKTRDHTRRSKSNIDMTHVKLAVEKQAEQKCLSRSSSDENLNLLKTEVSEKNRYQQKTPSQIGSKINAAILSEIEHDNQQYLRSLNVISTTNDYSQPPPSTQELPLETTTSSLPECNVAEKLKTRTGKALIAKVDYNQDKLHVTAENEQNQTLLERGENMVNKQTSHDSLQPLQTSALTSVGTRIEENLISPNSNTTLFDSSQGDGLHIPEMERIKDPAYIKKGWLLKQNEKNKGWLRYWFVLKGITLIYYKDQKSEEQNIADGIIKLHGSDRVGKTDVSKNFGYFIQSKDAHHVLSALTEGIRNNWLQALTGSIEAQKCLLQKSTHSKSIAKPEFRTGYSEGLDNKSFNERNERLAETVIKAYTGKQRDKSPKVSSEKDINKNEVMADYGSTPPTGDVMAVANRLPAKDSSANFISGEKFDSLVPVCIVPPSSSSTDLSLVQPEAESSQKRVDKANKQLPQNEASWLKSKELELLESEIQTLRQRRESVATEKNLAVQKSFSHSDFRSQVAKSAKEHYWPEKGDHQLSAELQESKKLSALLSKQCDVLKQSVNTATDVINKQQNEIRNVHARHDRDTALLTDKDSTITFSQKALAREKEKFVALNQEWEKHVNGLEVQIKTLQTQLYDQDTHMKEMNERLELELLQEKETQQQVIDQQKQTLDELKLDLTTKSVLVDCNSELTAEIESLKNELDSTRERCLLAEGSLTETDTIRKELLKKIQAQEHLIQHQKEQLDTFQAKHLRNSELQSEVDDLATKYDELQDDITFKQDELLHVTSHNEALKEDNASLKLTIEKLVKEKNLVQEELESAYSETDKLQICVEELQSGCSDKERLLLELKDRLDIQEKRNSELSTLNEKLNVDILELKAEASDHQSSGTIYAEPLDGRVKQLEEHLFKVKEEHSHQMALQKAEYEMKLSKLNEAPINDEAIKLRFQEQIRQLKEMTEKGSTALQVSHRQLIQEMRNRHHQEIEELKQDHVKALAEETAATRSALDAIKREHHDELVKQIEVFKRQYEQENILGNSSVHEEKLEAVKDEVRLLSEQYSIKCLENASLAESLSSQAQRLEDLQASNQDLHRRIAIQKNSSQTQTGAESSTSFTLQASLRAKEIEVEDCKAQISLLKTDLNEAQKEYEKDKERHDEICRQLEKEKQEKEGQLEKLSKRVAEFGSHRPRSRERTRRFSSSPSNDDIPTNESGAPASSTQDDFKRPYTLRTKSCRRSQSMPVCYRHTVDLGPDGWFSLQTPVGIVANRLRYFESNDNDV